MSHHPTFLPKMLGFRALPPLNFPSKFKPPPQNLHLLRPNSPSLLTLKPQLPNLNRNKFQIYAENGNDVNKNKDDNNGLATENYSNGEEGKVKNEQPRFNLKWADLLLDPNPDNIVAVGLTGLLTWASVQGRRISEEGSIANVSDVVMKNTNGTEPTKVERIHSEKVASNCSSTSRAENMEVVPDSDTSRKGKERMRRLECTDDNYRSHALDLIHNMNQGKNCDLNVNGLEYTKSNGEHAVKEIRPVMDQWGVKSNWLAASCGLAKGVAAQWKFNNFLYHDEGPLRHSTPFIFKDV